ncbi:hypothetical protein [Planotetraspora sp. GP83]|uniref:cupredoxin domain-containing protein n=1 Tax=Planotetraspora sp. GP83 TaxID=3156264 RepID=UPI003517450C
MRKLLITVSVAMTGLVGVTGCAAGDPDGRPEQSPQARTIAQMEQPASPLPASPDVISAGDSIRVTGKGPVPRQLVTGTGETITWRNETAKPISVRLIDGSKPSGAIPPGGTYTHVFDTAGSFAYRIGKSDDPAGVVEVLPQPSSEPTPAASAVG